ncbi:GNAT family N-acetyltransferase [Alkalimonas sp.]|uniref:GNAT family N-acetyltransferase n=1 Tax=Alkalimonas sp. TaxID=1872453 RepID=UPI00263A4FCD|nr:GNAT family N-acetyltransferase [Alkalimonas sp.]MCC5825870.1 GNAT family N-acetyltransferase [Alkalimonas sp.]
MMEPLINACTFHELAAEDQPEADAFIAILATASPYLHSGWRRAVEQAYGHAAGCLVARDTRQPEQPIRGILPYVHFKRPLASCRLISQPFCDFSGPLAVSTELEQALVKQLHHRQPEAIEIRYGNTANPELASQKVRMVTPLPESADILLASYKPKLRSQIKKAEKNGLTAEVRTDRDAVRLFYQVYGTNMKRLGSPPHSLAWFDAILQHYPAGQAVLGLVWYQNVAVGAGLVLLQGEQAVIPWASTLADYNHLAPNMLLYWTLQAHLADHGVRFFDMGRSTPEEGTYRFKKQWGAEPVPLDWQLLKPQQSGITHLLSADDAGPSRLRSLAEKAWQQLPLPLANGLGARIRRYIAL